MKSKRNLLLTLTLVWTLVLTVTSQAHAARFWGWEKEVDFDSAYTDGTVFETYNYYVLGIKVDSEVRCRPCC